MTNQRDTGYSGRMDTSPSALRRLNYLKEERKAVVQAVGEVITLSKTARGEDSAAGRALSSAEGTQVRECLADLADRQRDGERHDAHHHETGEETLARFVEELRGGHAAAVAAAQSTSGLVRVAQTRRANAHMWAINTLRPLAEAEIATARAEYAEAEDWLTTRHP